jgi:predicted ATPase/DNA-binding SARP family transcriptional activator
MIMARLSLSLLGPLLVTLEGQPVSGFESNKVRALLIYLAAEADRPHQRDTLAGLLWPELTNEAARSNLRQALANLRQAISDRTAEPPFLLITRATLQFNQASDHTLDVATFDALLAACAAHTHRHPATCRSCMQRIEQAVGLYRGGFLAQFSLSDSAAFEEWALLRRERQHQLAIDAVTRLATYHEQRGAYEQAQTYAARQLELDTWREESYRQLMRVLHLNGQRTEALAQYERCRRVLAEELDVEPEEETTTLYEQIKHGQLNTRQDDAEHTLPRQPADMAAGHRLPAQLTSFVGREAELAALGELLANPACRLITILGSGGIGKSRLALQAAMEQAEMFPEGVVFVALAVLNSADFLVPTIMAALGIPSDGSPDEKDQLFAYLSERELLLLLDNFEQVLEGAELVAEILLRAPGVTLLVTSRERLALQGEWLFDLEGLSYPSDEASDTIEHYSAVQLFTQRARQVHMRFTLEPSEARSVARICRLVEGLPLAIELAAATVRERPCAEIATAIETNLRSLVTPLRDVTARHRSMWATFEHSWRQLSREQRCALRRLAIFRGGFAEDAAAQVAGVVANQLSALADKSLLRRDDVGRYDTHELLRQFAGHKLRAAGEHERMLLAHLEYSVQLAESTEPHLVGDQQAVWLDRLELEYDNIRAALGWSLEQRRDEQAARLAGAIWRFWGVRGHVGEGRAWLERLLAPGRQISPALRAKALKGNAMMAWSQGEYTQAVELCEQGLALYQAIGDTDGIAACLHTLGSLSLHQGDYARAKSLLEASLALRREMSDRWGISVCLANLGALAGRQGDSAQAERFYLESLALQRPYGDKERIAILLDNLGAVAWDRGDLVRARQLYEEGLALLRELNNKWNIPTCLNNLGGIAIDQHDYARGSVLFRESLLLLRDLGDKEAIAACLEGLGGVAGGHNQAERAVRLYGAAEQLRVTIGSARAPVARSRYERLIAVARAQLDEAAFTAAWAEGRMVTLGQAIADALNEVSSTPAHNHSPTASLK